MRLALVLTALALAAPAQADALRPGLWRLTYEGLYEPGVPENIASRTVETVCVGDSAGLDPARLKSGGPSGAALASWAALKGDPARAYSIFIGGGPPHPPRLPRPRQAPGRLPQGLAPRRAAG